MTRSTTSQLAPVLDRVEKTFDRALGDPMIPAVRERGTVRSIGAGACEVIGLPRVGAEELVRFSGGAMGLVLNLEPESIGVVLLDHGESIEAGDVVRRTGRVMDVPVGDGLLGRVVDPLGRPHDDQPSPRTDDRLSLDREAPAILDRAPVNRPLQTGLKVVDATVPIGRGQRELILGDRQTGKTSIAIDTILNQTRGEMICVYCAIGQRLSAVAKVIEDLRTHGAMEDTVVVVAAEDQPPGLRYAAPYAATSIAEHFMHQGRDALIVYDDLTRHARAYRELSLLLRRPPGREAYPGDIFYIHARLLERATQLNDDRGGGSLTALPIIETQAQNISAYIPTNLVSITDGQIYLSPKLFHHGQLPAVDVGRSVSRVGGKAQLPALRDVSGDLKLAYSQFEELERFTRYGARLDQDKRRQLEHGRHVRRILRQAEHDTMSVVEQVVVLLAITEGLFDEISLEDLSQTEQSLRERTERLDESIRTRITQGQELGDEDRRDILEMARDAMGRDKPVGEDAGSSRANEEDSQPEGQRDADT